MLICIPTPGNTGRDDTVHDHFGSAPFFTLYDSETDNIEVLDNSNAHHAHGTCHPINQLGKYHINGIVCGGMGRRAIEALTVEGIKIYQAKSKMVAEVIEQVKANDLIEMGPAKACRGHGQHPKGLIDFGHTCGHGRGAGFGQAGHGQGHGGGRGDQGK